MRDPIADLKHELMAAAERQLQQHAAAGAGRRRLHVSLSRNRVLLTTATVAIAAAATLLFTTPWNRTAGLGFLEQVQAALTPPAGTILHTREETTTTSSDPACTVTRANEIWIDQTPPHRWRALSSDLPPNPTGAELACIRGTPFGEVGWGRAPSDPDTPNDTPETVRFVPPNTLADAAGSFSFSSDYVKDLREAISAGGAHDEGTTLLDGRTVKRIRFADPPSDCRGRPCSRKPRYAYVDPETFYPVQVECEDCVFVGPGGVVRVHVVSRFLTYELLPRTNENLALTDILAQHPNATRSWTTVLHVPVAKTVRAAKGAKSARVTFEVTATDENGRGDVPVSCSPESGSRFPLGETTVDCVAMGSKGMTWAAFTVTVKRRR